MKRSVLSLSLLALAMVASAQPAPAGRNLGQQIVRRKPTMAQILGLMRKKRNETVPGYAMVKLTPAAAKNLSKASVKNMFGGWGTYQRRIGNGGWTLWKLPAALQDAAFLKRAESTPGVVYAQPLNRIYPLMDEPNDPDFNAIETSEDLILWFGEDPRTFRRLWNIGDVGAFEAWSDFPGTYYDATTKPLDTPTIAVIDTGCDMDHPDFANEGAFSTDIFDGGQLDFGRSAKFAFGEPDPFGSPNDRNGHGTHVSGIALAAANNGTYASHGMIGTGYNAQGMILRVFDDTGNGTDADAASAIYYAADHGADVINLSLGTENFSLLFQDAVTYATEKGCLVVAAGNEDGGGGGDLGPIYPAACSGALAVTANGPDYIPATNVYSGTGRYMDMAAPGGTVIQEVEGLIIQFVFSTSMREPGDLYDLSQQGVVYPPYTLDYSYLVGTSMACPHVSGAAALYMGKHNLRQTTGWANVRTMQALMRSAIGAGAPYGSWEPTQGYGSLNMPGALNDEDTRGAVAGSVEGMVFYNGIPVSNARVEARRLTGTTKTTTSTQTDGSYRYDALQAGDYEITSTYFGVSKSQQVRIVPGADVPAVNVWIKSAGDFDSTPPEVPTFEVVSADVNSVTVRHRAFDTETNVPSIAWRIGRSFGSEEVLPETQILGRNAEETISGISLVPGQLYWLIGRYTNGDGDVQEVNASFIPTGKAVVGQLNIGTYVGKYHSPFAVRVRNAGSTTTLHSFNVRPNVDGLIAFPAPTSGNYDIAVKGPTWLRVGVGSVGVNADGGSFSLTLPMGDVTGDNRVNASDQARIRAAMRSRPGQTKWDAAADINGDGVISAIDHALMNANFGRTGLN